MSDSVVGSSKDDKKHSYRTPPADTCSIWLAVMSTVGFVAWIVISDIRYTLPIPTYWFTAAVPIWAALILLGLQMVCLVASAITATRREQVGMSDMFVSIGTFVVTVIIGVLFAVNAVHFGANQLNGLLAFLWTNTVEMFATIGVWMVANRRPGGVIGSLTN